jgi:uncharacterized membrane protein YagU involved in acid resistance
MIGRAIQLATVGAAAGLVATVPMTAVMALMHRRIDGGDGRLPPQEVTEGVLEKAGADDALAPDEKAQFAVASHFMFGAAAGAVYGPLSAVLPLRSPAGGVLYALGVWSSAYLGYLPATGVRHSATEDRSSRNALMIAAHVAWGASMAVLLRRLSSRPSVRSSQ